MGSGWAYRPVMASETSEIRRPSVDIVPASSAKCETCGEHRIGDPDAARKWADGHVCSPPSVWWRDLWVVWIFLAVAALVIGTAVLGTVLGWA